MRYILSIHDVWPGNRGLVDAYLRRLRAWGAGPIALLVVPDYHGRGAIDGDAAFLDWLRAERAGGSEVLLHGYRHLAAERAGAATARRSAWGRWVNRNLVAGEAEFSGIPAADGALLLTQAMTVFRRSEFPVEGFVAPTWHGSPTQEALQAQGLRFRETRFRIQHLASGRWRFVPPLAWTPTGRGPVLMGGKPWLRALMRLPWIKVALHPGDLDGNAAEPVLCEVFANGTPATYGGALAEMSTTD